MSQVDPSGNDVPPQHRPTAPEDLQPSDQCRFLCHNSIILLSSVLASINYQAASDSTAGLDAFSALHISNPPSRIGSLPPNGADPIPRAPSAMSLNAATRAIPRHAATLPLPPARSHTPFAPGDSSQPPQGYQQQLGNYPPMGYRSYDELGHQRQGGYISPDSFQHQEPQYIQSWQQQQPQYAHPVPPVGGGYNVLHAAASDVLGMGPPPGAVGMSRSIGPGPSPSNYAPVSPSHTSNSGMSYGNQTVNSVDPYASNNQFDTRPSYQRAATSASIHPSSTKSKAVDLNSPPYTKEYIDQYRQRMKGDPDPEAHFLYAKYLVDAAKHIRTSLRDQKTAKKYTEQLVTESLKVIRRLATQGEAYDEAQFFLANCYGTGALGLQVDHERAYHLYLQAAKQNHAAACYRVAVCNEIGAGTKKEPTRAGAFYRKAASLGDTPGMYKLGMILLHGLLGEQRNPREAFGWLKRAAEQADEDNPHAVHELALLYENQSGTPVPYDPAYAKTLLIQAGQLGYATSQYKLGQCFEYGTLACPVDPKRSIAWYTKAAEKGHPEAELALSGWYLTGSEGILKQSDSEAYLWARRAANKGLSKAEYAVGYYAEVGIGIKQDIEFAKKWYMRAAGSFPRCLTISLTHVLFN